VTKRNIITELVFWGDQVKEDEMDRACSMHGRNEKYGQNCYQNMKERDHLKELGIEGMIILEWILGK
jgi:hypothetical protein